MQIGPAGELILRLRLRAPALGVDDIDRSSEARAVLPAGTFYEKRPRRSVERVQQIDQRLARRKGPGIDAHVEMRNIAADSELAGRLAVPGYKAKLERACLLTLETFDWNCPQHITPRYTIGEIEAVAGPLQARIAQLEAEN